MCMYIYFYVSSIQGGQSNAYRMRMVGSREMVEKPRRSKDYTTVRRTSVRTYCNNTCYAGNTHA